MGDAPAREVAPAQAGTHARSPAQAPAPVPASPFIGRWGTGIRARVYLSLVIAAAAMVPVVAVSLFHTRQVALALQTAEETAAEVQQAVDALPALLLADPGPEPEALEAEVRSVDAALASLHAARVEALTALRESQRNVLTVLLLTALVSVLLLVYLPRSIMSPVQRILNVVRRAEHGDYEADLPLGGADEVGEIALSLRRLLDRLRTERAVTDRLQRGVRQDLALLGRGLSQALCIVDRDLTVTWANASFTSLIGAEDDVSGRPLEVLIPDAALLALVRRAFAGGTEEETLRFVDQRGEHHKQRLSVAGGHAATGEVDRVALVFSKAGLLR